MSGSGIPRVLFSTVALMLVWMALTLSLDVGELVLGAAVSLLVAASTGGAFTGGMHRLLAPRRLLAALSYGGYFILQMVRANLDVLLRVMRPRVPVRPGIVAASLTLPSMRARTVVANSITLTPGTLTVDLDREAGLIYVHWISLPEGDAGEETQRMVDGFARRMAVLLG